MISKLNASIGAAFGAFLLGDARCYWGRQVGRERSDLRRVWFV